MSALEWLATWWSRVVAGFAFAVVAGVTGRISYMHIEGLTLAMHQPPVVATLMPFGVDGLIVVGSVALLQAAEGQERLGWICVGPGAAASLFANVESGWRYGVAAAAWAGMASAGFILATFTLERWLKGQFGRGGQGDQPNTDATEDGDDVVNANPCSHYIASTAEESAIQAWLHAQDCLHEPLSQRQLSARFQISRPRVAELVAPYLPAEPIAAVNGSPDAN
jgi:uncharacterized protein DUF2637